MEKCTFRFGNFRIRNRRFSQNYTHGTVYQFHSFEPWSRKTAWIKSLFCRAVRICSNTFFLNRQISTISKFMAWNGFPANFRCAIHCKFKRVVLTPRGNFRPFCKRVVLTLRKGRFNSEGSFGPIKGSK